MTTTFGAFAVAVAFGDAPTRQMSAEEAARSHAETAEAIAPAILAIRAAQRRAAESLAGEPLMG